VGGGPVVLTEHLSGDRAAVRAQTVAIALQGVLSLLADA
jgi:nicotinamide mononucleotide (NMN) deamidase PncC